MTHAGADRDVYIVDSPRAADDKVYVINGQVVDLSGVADGDLVVYEGGQFTVRKLVDGDVPDAIARDSEVTTTVAAEATARSNADTAEAATRAAADTAEATARANADALALAKASNLSDVADIDTSKYNLKVPALRSAVAVATSNVASLSGVPTIDGFACSSGDRVLLTAQTTASQNGPWLVAAGAWTRPNDYPVGGSVRGRIIEVNAGTVYAGTLWVLTTTTAVTVDTDGTTWALIGVAAGAGLAKTGNTIGLSSSYVTQVNATNHAWPIPTGATKLRITAVGGGGQGGGAGSAATGATQGGGGGGGAASATSQVVSVGANTTLDITIGAGGASLGAGGAAGGNTGATGSNGGDTTVVGTGISVTAKGGAGGQLSAASTATAGFGGLSARQTFSTNSILEPGGAGGGAAVGNPGLGYQGGGGGGGTASTSTNGGVGGSAGTSGTGGGIGSTGGSGTSAGTNGADAGANTGAGGGGGGGGTAGTGKGGNGGAGGSGYVVIEVVG